MKNLQINETPIGAQEYPLTEKVSEDIYIYQEAIKLSGFGLAINFWNASIAYNAARSVPNLPSLENRIYLYIKPNPDIAHKDSNHYWYDYHNSRGFWELSDTGYRYLLFNPNTEYQIFGSIELFTDSQDVSNLATLIAKFRISGNKVIQFYDLYPSWSFKDGQTCTINSVNKINITGSSIQVYLNSDNPYIP